MVYETRMADGSLRRSLGTKTAAGGIAEPIPGDCEGLADATAALRSLVDGAAYSLLRSLQPLQRGPVAMLATGGSQPYASLVDAARAGEQLEHFHSYRASPSAAAATPASDASTPVVSPAAAPLHTDAGLFIAFVPAMFVEESTTSTTSGGSSSGTSATAAGHGSPPHQYAAAADGNGAEGSGDGFYVQRWDGTRARVSPASESSSVVFLLGDGWSQWLNPQLDRPLRAAPHGLIMKNGLVVTPRTSDDTGGEEGSRSSASSSDGSSGRASSSSASSRGSTLLRVWYGRMYLPPADAVQHAAAAPFRDWRAFHAAHPSDLSTAAAAASGATPEHLARLLGTTAASADITRGALAPSNDDAGAAAAAAATTVQPSGCAGGRRFLSVTNSSLCLADQILCWHQCVDVSELPCGEGAVCWRYADDTIWLPDDEHCTSCAATCIDPPPPAAPLGASPTPPPPPFEAPFCTGSGTDMHMSGFTFYPADCVILLFQDWKLDSAAAFTFGVLGTLVVSTHGVQTTLGSATCDGCSHV